MSWLGTLRRVLFGGRCSRSGHTWLKVVEVPGERFALAKCTRCGEQGTFQWAEQGTDTDLLPVPGGRR